MSSIPQFQFDFSDPGFCRWLIEALQKEGTLGQSPDGPIVIEQSHVTSAMADGVLGDRFVNLPQKAYLLSQLRYRKFVFDGHGSLRSIQERIRDKGWIAKPLVEVVKGRASVLAPVVEAFFRYIKLAGVTSEAGRWGRFKDFLRNHVTDRHRNKCGGIGEIIPFP